METLEQCPLCVSPDVSTSLRVIDHHLTQEIFTVASCSSCGFAFTNPRPSAQELGHYYASANYISHSNRQRGLVASLYYFARSIALRSKYHTITRLTGGKSLLDYGCGAGAFLAHMRARGYSVEGVEPGAEARILASQTASCTVHTSLDDIGPRQYDVITLWHVLEHVSDPSETLHRLKQLLSPTGVLLIAVPDLSSWDAQHYGPFWAALDVPRHLSHFRPLDLHLLAQNQELQLAATHRQWFDAVYISLLSERYSGHGAAVSLFLGVAKGCWSNLFALFTGRSTSSTLFVLKSRH